MAEILKIQREGRGFNSKELTLKATQWRVLSGDSSLVFWVATVALRFRIERVPQQLLLQKTCANVEGAELAPMEEQHVEQRLILIWQYIPGLSPNTKSRIGRITTRRCLIHIWRTAV